MGKTVYTQELADQICERLATGEPMTHICAGEGMPCDRTVRLWADPNASEYRGDAFAAAIADSRARGFDAIAAGCLEIADDARNDWMERAAKDGEAPTASFNAEHVQRSKLRIETRLKLLAKWDPKRYGEKLALGGADDLPPIKTVTDEQLMARIQALQAKISGDKA